MTIATEGAQPYSCVSLLKTWQSCASVKGYYPILVAAKTRTSLLELICKAHIAPQHIHGLLQYKFPVLVRCKSLL